MTNAMSTRLIFGFVVEKPFLNNQYFFTEIEQMIFIKRFFVRDTHTSNDVGAAAKEPTELFSKNTGLCKHESGCIGADSCPMLEG